MILTTDNRTAVVIKYALSPFWPECQLGIERLYITAPDGHSWADWILPQEVLSWLW